MSATVRPAGAAEVDAGVGIGGLRPDWPAPVGALMTTRAGGVSGGPWRSLNLGTAVGDAAVAVAENRRRVAAAVGVEGADSILWLHQVHGTRVIRAESVAACDGAPPEADAAWTDEPGLALAIQVADCLPVLFAAPDGSAVAAAHAGWRGLAGGVLEATLAALCEGAGCAPSALRAWLGPCIGPQAFEVGADVLAAFGADPAEAAPVFRRTPRPGPDGAPRWWADLPALARRRLRAAGVPNASGGSWCTVSDPSAWFSYRRDGVTGRLAALVWRRRAGAG